MGRYLVEHGGSQYEVEANSEAEALAVFDAPQQEQPGNAPPLPDGGGVRESFSSTEFPSWQDQEALANLKAMGGSPMQGPKPEGYRGNILPFQLNDQGQAEFAVPNMIHSPATLPGDVYTGKIDPNSNEAMDRSRDFAAVATPAAPRGSGGFMGAPQAPMKIPTTPPGVGLVDKAAGIGVTNIPNAVMGGELKQGFGQRFADMPWGYPLRRSAEKGIKQLEDAKTATQGAYGSGSIPAAGEGMREGIEGSIGPGGVSQKAVGKEYDKAISLMEQGVAEAKRAGRPIATDVPLRNTAGVAEEIQSQNLESAIPGGSAAVRYVQDAIQRHGLSYKGIKGLRTRIGEMIDTGALPADSSGAEFKRIYSALTQDLETAVNASGNKEAIAQWRKANTLAAMEAKSSKRLKDILGSKNDEGLIDRVLAAGSSSSRADIKLLSLARKAVDNKKWDELAAAAISRMGSDGKEFSPARFLTAYAKLTPAAKRLLFRSTGKDKWADSLDTIAEVSAKFERMNRLRNTSGTAAAAAVAAAISGLFINPLAVAGGVLGTNVMSHMLARPARAAKVADFMEAVAKAAAKKDRSLLREPARALARAVVLETNTPELYNRVYNALINPDQEKK